MSVRLSVCLNKIKYRYIFTVHSHTK